MFTQSEVETPTNSSCLTRRQIEVLTLIAENLSSQQVADSLFVSASTVNFHLGGVYSKLNVSNRVEAINVARSNGLL